MEDYPLDGIHVGPINDNVHELLAVIEGPSGSYYEGGVFFVDVTVPKNYPFSPPQLKFSKCFFFAY